MTRRTLAATVFLAFVSSLPPPGATPASTAAAFERFKALDGTWEGTSSKGRTDRATFKTIASS